MNKYDLFTYILEKDWAADCIDIKQLKYTPNLVTIRKNDKFLYIKEYKFYHTDLSILLHIRTNSYITTLSLKKLHGL